MTIQDLVLKKYSELSTGQKKVAEYLLQNTFEFSMSTAAQLAKKVNVSETTIIRLSYALGFESFSVMQKYIKNQFLNKKDSQDEEVSYSKKGEKSLLNLTIQRDIAILKSMLENLDMDKIYKVTDLLKNATEVKIAGYRASFSSAHWFFTKLSMMRDNVTLISSLNSFNSPDDLITKRSGQTVFFLLSFPSYISETLNIAKIAKNQGAKVIVISDRMLSPVARVSDICITTDINVSSENLISVSSVHSLLNLIATEIEINNDEAIAERVRMINDMYSKNGYYLE